MARVRKSPNMMSTTGRMPVMAAPTASPVMPASEIGESMTRSGPNSSTRPDSTLKGVPASATSSPRMKTRSSARISSARASFTAWENVSSRPAETGSSTSAALRVDILVNLPGVRVRGRQPELHAGGYLVLDLLFQALKRLAVRSCALQDPVAEQPHGVTVGLPVLFLLLRPVVRTVHVPDVVAEPAIGHAFEERGALAPPGAVDGAARGGVHRPDVLAVHDLGRDTEGLGSRGHVTGRGLRVRGVLVVEVVLADVDQGQLPQRGHVHDLVQHPLPEGPLAEEARRHLVAAAQLHRQ